MPNHVTNILTTNDEKLLEFISNPDDKDGNIHIDFNKIIPMPTTLDIESSSEGKTGIELVKFKDFGTPMSEWAQEVINKSGSERLTRMEQLGRQYLENIKNYGHQDWYSWSIQNWGTKWNAYNQSRDGNSIRFDTAWSTPEPIFRKLAELFPNSEFEVKFADEDIGNNCGIVTYKNGKEEEYISKHGNIKFSCEIKGRDYEQYLRDLEENRED